MIFVILGIIILIISFAVALVSLIKEQKVIDIKDKSEEKKKSSYQAGPAFPQAVGQVRKELQITNETAIESSSEELRSQVFADQGKTYYGRTPSTGEIVPLPWEEDRKSISSEFSKVKSGVNLNTQEEQSLVSRNTKEFSKDTDMGLKGSFSIGDLVKDKEK